MALWVEEGLSSFFHGALERSLRSGPQFAVTLSVADALKSIALDRGFLGLGV